MLSQDAKQFAVKAKDLYHQVGLPVVGVRGRTGGGGGSGITAGRVQAMLRSNWYVVLRCVQACPAPTAARFSLCQACGCQMPCSYSSITQPLPVLVPPTPFCRRCCGSMCR